MKVAPVYAELARRRTVEQQLIHTGPHYRVTMRDTFSSELALPRPHIELNVGSGSHAEQTARALIALERTFVELAPNLLVVAGDANPTLSAALAAVKLGIPVCHVEAGLRSFEWATPEEHNRRLTDSLSSLLLTHCEDAHENLAAEGIADDLIAFVGNTMIDTLFASVPAARARRTSRRFALRPRRYLLVALHQPALVDNAELLGLTMEALERTGRRLAVLFPMHPRTQARVRELGFAVANITITRPLPYQSFVSLELDAAAVLTDSGSVQEETTALRVPCFTLRETTERAVTLTLGTNSLLGLEPRRIEEIPDRLDAARATGVPPLWDGLAGKRAAHAIERSLGVDTRQVA
jgi:UDP-N-acetylglucosamine 2-epimerase (non-hydrolysing)